MKFTQKIPSKVKSCPIQEAIVELRFKSNVDSGAVFGILYKELKNKFPKDVKRLPILEFPDAIRTQDANFKYKPYYRLERDNFLCQIGPDVLSIVILNPYSGWDNFSNEIFENIDILKNAEIVQKIERLGIRFVNFFEGNIFNETQISLTIAEEQISSSDLSLTIQEERNSFNNKIKFDTTAFIRKNNVKILGTVVDIDTVYKKNIEDFNSLKQIINDGHQVEKEIFYNLLTKKLIDSLSPEYA